MPPTLRAHRGRRTGSTGANFQPKCGCVAGGRSAVPGPEDSTGGGVLEPDLQQRNRTAAALKFNLRRQTESAAPSCTSSRLTRRQSAELEERRREEGGEEGGGGSQGGHQPHRDRWMCAGGGPCQFCHLRPQQKAPEVNMQRVLKWILGAAHQHSRRL